MQKYYSDKYKDLDLIKLNYKTKKEIEKILKTFKKPFEEKIDRYSYEIIKTNVFEKSFNIVYNKFDVFNLTPENMIDYLFDYMLLDFIEIQYDLLAEEAHEFSTEINKIFYTNNEQCCLHNGRIIVINQLQWERDLKIKAMDKNLEFYNETTFGSSYNEFKKAIELYEKSEYEQAIAQAICCYESVMKIFLNENESTIQQLVEIIVKKIDIPNDLAGSFKDKILQGPATIRNKIPPAHGQGVKNNKATKELANLTINLVASLSIFLIEEWEKQNNKKDS